MCRSESIKKNNKEGKEANGEEAVTEIQGQESSKQHTLSVIVK